MIGSFSLDKKESGRPLKLYEASLFQFINPKAWSIAIAVASGFFPTEENIFIGISFVTITAAIICFPSISLWASYLKISLSLHVPGSLSSALTTKYFGVSVFSGINDHFNPVGNPAPPLPLRPDNLISSIIQSDPLSIIFFVSLQHPLLLASFNLKSYIHLN